MNTVLKYLYGPALAAGLAAGLAGCQSASDAAASSQETEAAAPAAELIAPDLLGQLSLEPAAMRNAPGRILCNGVVDAPPQSLATLSSYVGGMVREIRPIPGDYVAKGALVAVLEHPDFIRLQQQYLETRSATEFLRKEFERQQTLKASDAGIARTFEQTQADLGAQEARLAGLARELRLLGVEVSGLQPETLKSTWEIRAPFSGYVTEVPVNLGKYVAPQEAICEMVDKGHLHVELQVFEKDLGRVREGQKIEATVGGRTYPGYIKKLGQLVDPQTRALGVHAHLDDHEVGLYPGAFIDAVILAESAPALAVPAAARYEAEGETFCFAADAAGRFRKVDLSRSTEAGGWIWPAMPGALQPGDRIVVQGQALVAARWPSEQ